MTKPQSSPQVNSFLDSLKEEYPDEFTPDDPIKLKRTALRDIKEALATHEIVSDEGMRGYSEKK
jgi:hypothetical protein